MNNKISAKSVVLDYIEDSDIQGAVDESLLIRWISDYNNITSVAEELSHQITHLYVDNYKAELPQGLKKIQQVVARKKIDVSCTRKETVTKWLSVTYDKNCKIEHELVCDKCRHQDCTCENTVPIYEVDIDRRWLLNNPQHYLEGWSHTGSVGKGEGLYKDRQKEWVVLRPAMDDFYRNKYFLNDCLNFHAPNYANSFSIEPPIITADFSQGELIVSYLGEKFDEDGDIMVVDDAHYLEGLIHHLDYKWWAREAKRHAYSGKTNMRLFKQYSNQAKQERELSIGRYKARTIVPDYKDWNTFMKKVMNQRIPNREYDEGFKRGNNYSIFARYSNLLNNGDRIKNYNYLDGSS